MTSTTTTASAPTTTNLDQKRTWLDVLGILHYVYGAVIVVPVVLGAIALTIFSGVAMWEHSRLEALGPFAVFGSLFAIGLLYGVVNVLAGRWLRARRNWIGIVVVSAINCLNVPLGTLLGVFTIVVLAGDGVQGLFAGRPPAPAHEPARPGVASGSA
jgi:hypothetical protein